MLRYVEGPPDWSTLPFISASHSDIKPLSWSFYVAISQGRRIFMNKILTEGESDGISPFNFCLDLWLDLFLLLSRI